MSQIKKGFYINGNYAGMTAEAAFNDLAKIGYNAVEINYCDDLKKKKALAELSGLSISEVVCQTDYVLLDKDARNNAINTTLNRIYSCAEAGITTVNLFTGPVPWINNPLIVNKTISSTDAWGMLFEAFDQFVSVAEKTGVDIAVEGVWGHLCHDFFTTQYLINHYNSDRLGVNLDPSHDVLSGNTDMRFIINGWGKRFIKHIHLKDAVGIMSQRRFIFPALGEGYVDWNGFSQGLKDIGYEGTMSVEFESGSYMRVYHDGDLSKIADITYKAINKLIKL